MYQFNDSFPSRTVVSTVRPFNLASLKVSIFTCKCILVAPFVLVNPHYSSNVLSNLKLSFYSKHTKATLSKQKQLMCDTFHP